MKEAELRPNNSVVNLFTRKKFMPRFKIFLNRQLAALRHIISFKNDDHLRSSR